MIGMKNRQFRNRNTAAAANKNSTQRSSNHIFFRVHSHAVLLSAQKNILPQKRQDRYAASRWVIYLWKHTTD